ncbi:MAG: T9SS type A sorting domain-containing protein, partial [Fidelibacterota bacterium]
MDTKDLNSHIPVATDTWYHVAGVYDGHNFDLYLDGDLSAHSTFSGSILITNIDLMIGQARPDLLDYGFQGVLDDIRIYNYALKAGEILNLYDEIAAIHNDDRPSQPIHFGLSQNYPNPFNPQTTIRYRIQTASQVTLEIFDVRGRKVATLVNEYQQAGYYSTTWDARNASSGIYVGRLQANGLTATKKFSLLK